MSIYEKPPHQFILNLRTLKNKTYDESHLSSQMSQDPNERKHKRFPIEAYLLQQISSSYNGVLGFNPVVPANLADQFKAMEKGLSDYIKVSINKNFRNEAVHVAPYLRHRDKEYFLFNAERMNYEEAAIVTMTNVLRNSLHGSLDDDKAMINTMSSLLFCKFPEASSEEIGCILKRSTLQNEWFSHSHGKHDDPMKKEMGRYDSKGNDLLKYNHDFFNIIEGENGLEVVPNIERLSAFRENLRSYDPAITEELYCPAAYSRLIDQTWIGAVNIYEETGSFLM